MRLQTLAFLVCSPLAVACGSTNTNPDVPAQDAVVASDQMVVDVPQDQAPDVFNPAARCASMFGNGLTTGFGRIDGVVSAIVRPSDQQCTGVNSDHIVLEVSMNQAIYRMVVNIQSDRAGVDPRIGFTEIGAALPAPAWSEGWHTGLQLDYATTLNVHNSAVLPYTLQEMVDLLPMRIAVGSRVSVYATSGAGRPESAHLVHRNGANNDGAIVVAPDTANPRWFLFAFSNQTF